MKLETEAVSLRETYLVHRPPVAMRTFVGKGVQPGTDHFAYNGSVGAQSYKYSRFGVPQGGLHAIVSGIFYNILF